MTSGTIYFESQGAVSKDITLETGRDKETCWLVLNCQQLQPCTIVKNPVSSFFITSSFNIIVSGIILHNTINQEIALLFLLYHNYFCVNIMNYYCVSTNVATNKPD